VKTVSPTSLVISFSGRSFTALIINYCEDDKIQHLKIQGTNFTDPQNTSPGLALCVGNVGRLADIRNGPDCLRHVLPVAVLVQREGDVRRRTEVDRSNSGRTQADVEIVDDRSEELADVVHTLPLDTARRVDNEHEIDDTRATCCRQVHYVSMGACSADLWK